MYEESHSKIIKKGVEIWNKWRKDNPGITPKLSGAELHNANLTMMDLSKADLRETVLKKAVLIRADLSEAELSGAILIGADLRYANLSGAQLSQTNLSGVDLRWANLSRGNLTEAFLAMGDLAEADLSETKLVRADLSKASLIKSCLWDADLSGSFLDSANLSEWDIRGIKCDKIHWKGKWHTFKKGEFEKAFSTIEQTMELILEFPLSDIGYYTGRIIEEAVNQQYGEGTLLLKGQTAISNTSTQFEFIHFGACGKLDEIQARLSELKDALSPVIEQASEKHLSKSVLGIRNEIGIPFTQALVVRPKEVVRVLNERFLEMHPLLQKMIMTIQDTIK